ncbi:MAG: hypothetical protein P8Y23_03510 [Candidatus Lokiarchaeota archaeon]|jgi:hypothetical protein
MTKRSPLVVQYVENKKDHANVGIIFYIEGKKREKFLLDLNKIVKELGDIELFKTKLNPLIKKYSHKIKSWYYIEEGRAFNLDKKFRPLDFNPEYRELVIRREKNTNGEMIVVDYLGKPKFFNSFEMEITTNIGSKDLIRMLKQGEIRNNEMRVVDSKRLSMFNSRFVKVMTRNLDLTDKELIRNFREDEIKSENSSDNVIIVDYNNYINELFKRVFTFVYFRKDPFIIADDGSIRFVQEHSEYWKEKLKDLYIIKRLKTYGPDNYIYQDFITKFPKKIPREISETVLNNKFKRDISKINEKELTDFLTEKYFNTLICGDINFNDYPSQKITVYHAFDIDCDLLNTFNIHLKDLEPDSFQFIDIDYSDNENIKEIKLSGPIDYIL